MVKISTDAKTSSPASSSESSVQGGDTVVDPPPNDAVSEFVKSSFGKPLKTWASSPPIEVPDIASRPFSPLLLAREDGIPMTTMSQWPKGLALSNALMSTHFAEKDQGRSLPKFGLRSAYAEDVRTPRAWPGDPAATQLTQTQSTCVDYIWLEAPLKVVRRIEMPIYPQMRAILAAGGLPLPQFGHGSDHLPLVISVADPREGH